MRVICFRVPDTLYEELRRLAREKGYSTVSEYLRDVVQRMVYGSEREERLEELERRVRRLEADVAMLRSWILRLVRRGEGDKDEQ